MLVLGKGLGGGIFPLAALLAREDLDVARDRALGHYTHEKNPVASAAALAAIAVIEEEGLLERAQKMGKHALARLQALGERHAAVADVRGLGLLLGVELIDPGTGARAVRLAEEVLYCALSLGLSFKLSMGNVITLSPPLTVTQAQLDEALDILERALDEAWQRLGAPGTPAPRAGR